MTTIAYHHQSKTIAWDSRSVSAGVIVSDDHQKMLVRDGVTFWFSGCYADRDKMVDYYFGGRHEFVPDANCYALDDGRLFYCGVTDEHEFWKEPINCNHACGSGIKFALSAMDFGKSAKEAVEYAKTRDCFTGGLVHEWAVS